MIKIPQINIDNVSQDLIDDYSEKAYNFVFKRISKTYYNDWQQGLKDFKSVCQNLCKENQENKKEKRNKESDVKLKRYPQLIENYDEAQKILLLLNEILQNENEGRKYFIKSPKDIRSFCQRHKIKNIDEQRWLSIYLSKIFNWNSFCLSKNNGEENKIILKKIFNKLNVGVCPYCNRNYVSIFNDKKYKLITPSLDHFYPRKYYAYLGLSLWNLVPSCDYCNSKIKSSGDREDSETVDSNDLLYPYLEGFEDEIRFALKPSSKDPYLIVKACYNPYQTKEFYKDFKIGFEIKKSNANKYYKNLVKKSIRMFLLKEIYNEIHKENAVDIAAKTIYYNNIAYKHSYNKILSLYSKYNQDLSPIKPTDFLKFLLFGRSLNQESLIKEPLSKLKSDIFKQFKKDSDSNDYKWLVVNNKSKKNELKEQPNENSSISPDKNE